MNDMAQMCGKCAGSGNVSAQKMEMVTIDGKPGSVTVQTMELCPSCGGMGFLTGSAR